MNNTREYILEKGWADQPESVHLDAVKQGLKRVAIIPINLYNRGVAGLQSRPIPGHMGHTIVYKPQNSKIADAVYKLLNLKDPGKFKDPGYHKALGGLLDYTNEEIVYFLKKIKLSY